jgi:ribonuclease HII
MPEATRIGELLAFDLALARSEATARPCGAPLLFSSPSRSGAWTLAGFDEAGRGALGGPVVVGCVQFPWDRLTTAELGPIDDSKRLTARAREAAFARIQRCAAWAFGCASASEVDALGIVKAAVWAARRAYRRLESPCDLAVFDRGLSLGEPVALDEGAPARGGSTVCAVEQRGSSAARCGGRAPGPGQLGRPARGGAGDSMFPPGVAFTKGDMRSLHVAAASIVAKVTRDRLMDRLDSAFPGYEFSRHKGYGTERHRAALARLGPSPLHRRSFLHLADEAKSQSC